MQCSVPISAMTLQCASVWITLSCYFQSVFSKGFDKVCENAFENQYVRKTKF